MRACSKAALDLDGLAVGGRLVELRGLGPGDGPSSLLAPAGAGRFGPGEARGLGDSVRRGLGDAVRLGSAGIAAEFGAHCGWCTLGRFRTLGRSYACTPKT